MFLDEHLGVKKITKDRNSSRGRVQYSIENSASALIKWTAIWGMEHSMAIKMFTPLISRKSRRRVGTGGRRRTFGFYFGKKNVTFVVPSGEREKLKKKRKKEKTSRDKT